MNLQHRTALCAALLLGSGWGCRESLRITYDIAGERSPLYTRNLQTPIAQFQGSGSWDIRAVAALPGEHTPADGATSARTYRSLGDRVQIVLEDFFRVQGSVRQPESIVDGTYSITFTIPGANTRLPQAEVVLDRRQPAVAVLLDGSETSRPVNGSAQLEVAEDRLTFIVEDASPCEVTVDGVAVRPTAEGLFTINLSGVLAREVEVVAEDAAGNRESVRLSLSRDRGAPTVRLARPLARRTYDQSPSVALAVDDDVGVASVSLELNGNEIPAVSPGGGQYTAVLPLEPGMNKLAVRVTDRVGRATTIERSIDLARLPDQVVWDIRGADQVLHARDRHARVAEFRSGDDLNINVRARYFPSQAPPDDSAAPAQEFVREFSVKAGSLRLHLDDLVGELGNPAPPADGRYALRYSSPGRPQLDRVPEAVVLFDTTAPVLVIEDSPEVFRLSGSPTTPAATRPSRGDLENGLLVAAGSMIRFRVDDVSDRCVVSANGSALTPARDDPQVFAAPAAEGPMRVRVKDAAGNETESTFQIQLDRGPPSVEFIGLPADRRTRNPLTTVTLRTSDDDRVVSCKLSHNGLRVGGELRMGGELPVGEGLPVGTLGAAGHFDAELQLLHGVNTLRATVVDRLGQVGTATARVVCDHSGAADHPAHVFRIQRPDGSTEAWAVPAGVEIAESPGMDSRFQISAGGDRQTAMVLVEGIPAGETSGDGQPVAPFLIDRFEVTVERFRRHSPQWFGRLPPGSRAPDQPAVMVSWAEAQSFANWAGKRLPTTAQWEVAAAWDGKEHRKYPWGEHFEARRLLEAPALSDADLAEEILQGGLPTGAGTVGWLPHAPRATRLTRDVSPWSAVGLAGGVREWCRDVGEGSRRSVRGGSVVHPRDPLARATQFSSELFQIDRAGAFPRTVRRGDLGFRCVLELLPVDAHVAKNER